MGWPTRSWWAKAFSAIEARVQQRVQAERDVAERARVALEAAAEREQIEARLRAHAAVLVAVARDGWYAGDGGGVRRVERDGSTWFALDD